jgi:hypothetical protein
MPLVQRKEVRKSRVRIYSTRTQTEWSTRTYRLLPCTKISNIDPPAFVSSNKTAPIFSDCIDNFLYNIRLLLPCRSTILLQSHLDDYSVPFVSCMPAGFLGAAVSTDHVHMPWPVGRRQFSRSKFRFVISPSRFLKVVGREPPPPVVAGSSLSGAGPSFDMLEKQAETFNEEPKTTMSSLFPILFR